MDHKTGDEPVTADDRAADDLVRAGLRAAFPSDGLLSEESHDDLSRLEKERVPVYDSVLSSRSGQRNRPRNRSAG